jgi:hypothetical protein
VTLPQTIANSRANLLKTRLTKMTLKALELLQLLAWGKCEQDGGGFEVGLQGWSFFSSHSRDNNHPNEMLPDKVTS